MQARKALESLLVLGQISSKNMYREPHNQKQPPEPGSVADRIQQRKDRRAAADKIGRKQRG